MEIIKISQRRELTQGAADGRLQKYIFTEAEFVRQISTI